MKTRHDDRIDRVRPEGFRNALVVQIRHLGDVLLTTPVFQALRAHCPQATLTACVIDGAEPMLSLNPLVDRIEILARRRPGEGPLRDWTRQWRLLKSIRSARYDLTIDLTSNDRTAFLCWFSGARARLAYHRRGFVGKNRLYTQTQPLRPDQHIVRQHLELIGLAGIPSPNPGLSFHFTDQDLTRVRHLLGPTRRFAQFHPISRIQRKCWPDPYMAQLIDHIASQGFYPVLTASDDPDEKGRLAKILALVRTPCLDLSGQLSLKELGALSSLAQLFVGIDTGPMHIAAAMGTPVIALFGPSSERLWEPWCPQHLVLSQDLPCRMPCQRKSACQTIECLNELTPAMVLPQVDAFLRSCSPAPVQTPASAL